MDNQMSLMYGYGATKAIRKLQYGECKPINSIIIGKKS